MRAFDRWLFAPGPGSRVWGVRTGLTAIMFVRLVLTPYHELSTQPAALFRPPDLIGWLHQMPADLVITSVQVVGILAAACVLFGRRPRVPFATTWLCFLFLEALIDSRAKISHHQVTVLLAAVPLLFAPLSDRGDAEDDPRAGWPPKVAMIVVAGAYFFCGLGKLVASGASWFTSDNLKWVLASGARSSKPPTHAVAEFVVDHDVLVHAVALGTLVFELTVVLAVFSPRLRPAYVAGAAALHIGIFVTLGLDYWSWVAAAVVVFLPWESLLPDRQASSARRAISPSTS